ncbi:hypothetical protein BJ170DRAFT_713368 [Xylariales sp. AK1849]|nr:hypothetical protein BJ170DRAFT_713368 [Xylariales sp. AK1849]
MDKYNPTVLRKAIVELKSGSKSYTAAYDGAMKRIEGQLDGQTKLAKEVLSWITCAQRPLTKTELQHALAIKVGETKLDKDNIIIVRLVHYTAQKYFESTQDKWFPAAHSALAVACTTYLSFETFADGHCLSDQEFEDRLREYQFFEYAASHWGDHARAAPSCNAVLDFLRNPAQINASVQAKFTDRQWLYPGYSQKAPSGMVATHLAAIFRLGNITSVVWDQGNQDARDSAGRTPLSWAAENGYTEVVKLHLKITEVDVNAKDNTGRTLLY